MKQPLYTAIYGIATIVLFFILATTYQSCSNQTDSYTSTDTDQEDTEDSYTYQQEETSDASSLSNGYMVIAGNYLLEDNARAMVTRLRGAGYSNARKVVFDLSQYYTVIAGIYDSRSVASSVSSELNGKNIDNYVLRRQN